MVNNVLATMYQIYRLFPYGGPRLFIVKNGNVWLVCGGDKIWQTFISKRWAHKALVEAGFVRYKAGNGHYYHT